MQESDKQSKLNEKLWDSRASTYDRLFSFTRWTQRKLVDSLKIEVNTNFLDLGCGTGWAVRYAAARASCQGLFYGVDASSEMVKQAELLSNGYKNLHFIKSRAEELSLESNFFDVVISSNAFHHFSNPEKALEETCRVLKSKGKVYILDTTADHLFMRMIDRLGRKLEPGSVKLYSTKEFQLLYEKAGLHYIASKPIFSAIKVHIAEKPTS
jgi:ubiquinone/menaquinone biosynthesis C-methylase UbiE